MLFHSIDFAVFLPIVFILYWFVCQRSVRKQNYLLIIASCIFYAWWDWRFLLLIYISVIIDYFVGLRIFESNKKTVRKYWLSVSIFSNIGLLAFFKYYNFFLDSFVNAFSLFGVHIGDGGLDIILPVGISFYTFQTLSYTIDIYRKQIEPTRDFVAFNGFVAFFPQLVAGPIERAVNLLPQFLNPRKFNGEQAADGLRQMLWGLFKKLVIANNLGIIVDSVYNHPEVYSGSEHVWVAMLFAIQLYCDFSGYSDMAIGIAKLFGIKLQQNFAYPFFSKNFREFWRRWHISLSSWFSLYLYRSLGNYTNNRYIRFYRITSVFLISGLWHGANWTFVCWGLIHALFFLPHIIFPQRKPMNIISQFTVKAGIQMLTVFMLFSLSMVFFRGDDIEQSFLILSKIFSGEIFSPIEVLIKFPLVLIALLFTIEWFTKHKSYPLEYLQMKCSRPIRWTFYILMIAGIGLLSPSEVMPFIYFQF